MLSTRSVNALDQCFQSKIKIPRVRMGEQQEMETLARTDSDLIQLVMK
jgi:hypothetical protein